MVGAASSNKFWQQKEAQIRRSVAQTHLGPKQAALPRISVVNEKIFVFVELCNPLMVPIELSQLRLIVDFTPSEDVDGAPIEDSEGAASDGAASEDSDGAASELFEVKAVVLCGVYCVACYWCTVWRVTGVLGAG